MGTTANIGLRYPDLTAAPNVPLDIENLANDTDAYLIGGSWTDLTGLASGWTVPSGQVAQCRMVAGEVVFRGYLLNSSFTGGFTTVCDLPTGITAPAQQTTAPSAGNTSVARSIQVTTDRHIQAYTSGATPAWYSLANLRYRIN